MKSVSEIETDARLVLDKALGYAAEVLLQQLRATVGVQTTLTVRGTRLRALHPAAPGAPPRRVTGNLWEHAGLSHPGQCEWEVGIVAPVSYARRLEAVGHQYMERTIAAALPRMQTVVGEQLRVEVS